VCVCVSVCVCVYPAIRFHISQRIFSKFGGNLLRVMTRYAGYICVVCTQCGRTRVRAKRAYMCAFAYFLTDYVQICWEHTTTHHKRQGLRTFYFHVRAHACERACARARVIKRSLIYGRILFKFALNLMSHQVAWATHFHVHACERACASARVRARMCERARD
jgi:hypothetical protein